MYGGEEEKKKKQRKDSSKQNQVIHLHPLGLKKDSGHLHDRLREA
jgi:hypothetical protein